MFVWLAFFFLIASQFASKVWNHIGYFNCNERLNYDDVKLFANHNIFEKLINFDFTVIFQIDHNYKYDGLYYKKFLFSEHFQACRGSNCKSRQQCFFNRDNYMICNDCKAYCAVIEAQCAEAKALKKAEKVVTTEYLDKNSKLCPKCNARDAKKSECDHMTYMRCYVLFAKKCEHTDNKKTSVVNTNTAGPVSPAIKKSSSKTITCTKQFANIALWTARFQCFPRMKFPFWRLGFEIFQFWILLRIQAFSPRSVVHQGHDAPRQTRQMANPLASCLDWVKRGKQELQLDRNEDMCFFFFFFSFPLFFFSYFNISK